MKNILYKLKFVILAIGIASLGSCDAILDQDETDYGKGTNLVGFASATGIIRAEANGTEVNSGIPLKIIGPTVNKFSDEVTVVVNIDPSSTAQEGVNYKMESKTITLKPNASSDSFEGTLPITILTEGIDTPVNDAPVLVLNISEATSSGDIVVNNKTKSIKMTIAYTCPFDINDYAGTYIATADEFGIYIGQPEPFEVIVGPGENQITLVNPAAHPEAYDIIVDVDPDNGNLSMAKQPALNSNNLGYPYGELRWEGAGTSNPAPGFCVGVLDIVTTNTVNAGSFGEFGIVFEKQ